MINISFDNAFLLLAAIPLLALVLVPYFITINKDNRDGHVVASLALHLAIVMFATFALAGTTLTAVITETNVYVLADVSYSSNHNLDKVDEYVNEVKESLPRNSKMGVICFGKDYQICTQLGEKFTTVKQTQVDDSATDISNALNYAASLFKEGVIKRIVIITDGKQTSAEGANGVIKTIETLYEQNVYVDAMYLDNNIPQNVEELQISDVEFTKSTYLNHQSVANVLVQANVPAYFSNPSATANAIVSLSLNGTVIKEEAVKLTQGYNVVPFNLPTQTEGTFDYDVSIRPAQSNGDRTSKNNSFNFTQKVAGAAKVLLISGSSSDRAVAERLYGAQNVTSYIKNPAVPYTVEELCKYDEIILSNLDIRELDNVTSFIQSLDLAVSRFGKSLLTFGNLELQNKENDDLTVLENMLPLKYGNSDQDERRVCLVIDISRSMETLYHMQMAKQAAIQIINMLNEQDHVSLVVFAGENYILQRDGELKTSRNDLVQTINSLEVEQGTYLGAGLKAAYGIIENATQENKQIMLISDGLKFRNEPDDPIELAKKYLDEKEIITTSVAIVKSTEPDRLSADEGAINMTQIAQAGGGKTYYAADEAELLEVMLSDVADDVTETVVEGETPLNISYRYDPVLDGVDLQNLPSVQGYVFASEKQSATTVLSATYIRPSGRASRSPVYSYWNYGDGKVSSFTSAYSGNWVSGWDQGAGAAFFNNVATGALPLEKVDHPYTLNVEYDGVKSTVEIIPAQINPDATASVKVTLPDQESTQTGDMVFNGSSYTYQFLTPQTGKYTLDVTYSYTTKSFETSTFFNVAYSPEYDGFTTYDSSDVHKFIRHRGTVSTDGTITLENDERDVATYKLSLVIPFLIIAVVAFVADIVVRKLKWNDIKSLFVKTKK
ncbi:MAG: VWA domain-containing protein [Clostridia bacterium]|nr:VWA domain-containing protein [Clostridia bacterium]